MQALFVYCIMISYLYFQHKQIILMEWNLHYQPKIETNVLILFKRIRINPIK